MKNLINTVDGAVDAKEFAEKYYSVDEAQKRLESEFSKKKHLTNRLKCSILVLSESHIKYDTNNYSA